MRVVSTSSSYTLLPQYCHYIGRIVHGLLCSNPPFTFVKGARNKAPGVIPTHMCGDRTRWLCRQGGGEFITYLVLLNFKGMLSADKNNFTLACTPSSEKVGYNRPIQGYIVEENLPVNCQISSLRTVLSNFAVKTDNSLLMFQHTSRNRPNRVNNQSELVI
eukprot:sb/3472800/